MYSIGDLSVWKLCNHLQDCVVLIHVISTHSCWEVKLISLVTNYLNVYVHL